jgi:hypothetical protein
MNRKKSKPQCVYEVKKNGEVYRYIVRTVIKGKTHYLGCYKTRSEAVKVYDKFAAKLGITR